MRTPAARSTSPAELRPATRTLVTGFLGFGDFLVNPSALLAESSSRRFRLIEVAYEAVDKFIVQLDARSFDRMIMLGVAGKSSRMRLEHAARNRIGLLPDVRGFAPSSTDLSAIDAGGPDILHGTMWNRCAALAEETPYRCLSDDAGDYLGNYIYYRALARFGATHAVGFLHVPPLDRIDLPTQRRLLAEILDFVES
jgi:pyroglutamyl-peptidase